MPGWDDVNDSDWDADPSGSASEGAPSEEGAALAAPGGVPESKGWKGKEPRHLKFNISVMNFGGSRARGEEMYGRNAYAIPCFVGLCLEASRENLEQWTGPCETWEPPGLGARGFHMGAPPQ